MGLWPFSSGTLSRNLSLIKRPGSEMRKTYGHRIPFRKGGCKGPGSRQSLILGREGYLVWKPQALVGADGAILQTFPFPFGEL